MDQVWLFYEAATENRKFELLDFAVSMRLAFSADRKDWMNFVNSLKPKRKTTRELISPKEKFRLLKGMLSGK